MHYVIGDIHGCYNLFMTLLEKLSLTSEDEVILIGDIIDKAPTLMEQKNIIEWAMKHISEKSQFKMVLGNHEMDLLNYLRIYPYKGDNNGLLSRDTPYGFLKCTQKTKLDVVEFEKFMQKLPLFLEYNVNGIETYITHSWFVSLNGENCVNDIKGIDLKNCDISESVWDRTFSNSCRLNHFMLVHGHTPTISRHSCVSIDNRGKVSFKGKNINIDCGACFGRIRGGNLASYCLETKEVVYAY